MEFSVFRQVLIRALGHMQSIVEKRATLPILMNVKIEVGDDLVLSATNVDLELVEHVVADITLGGKTTLLDTTLQYILAMHTGHVVTTDVIRIRLTMNPV